MIVVDASVIVELLLQTPVGRQLADRLFDGSESLVAPHLIDIEVTQVLRRFARAGAMRPSRADEAIGVFLDMPITRYEHTELLPRIWQLRHNLTAYDAAYVALADALRAPLLTRDAGVAACKGRVKIELV
jgi:predicted nucleic acid-binding protein